MLLGQEVESHTLVVLTGRSSSESLRRLDTLQPSRKELRSWWQTDLCVSSSSSVTSDWLFCIIEP